MTKLEMLYRGLNAAVATAAIYQLITDPLASIIELGPDIAIHVFETLLPNSANEIGLAINVLRGTQAGIAAITGNTITPSMIFRSVGPPIANGLDTLVHVGNTTRRALNLKNDIQEGTTLTGKVISFLPFWRAKTTSVETPQNKSESKPVPEHTQECPKPFVPKLDLSKAKLN